MRGAAPGTRETDLLHPCNLVDTVHAVMLAGGSAWGLDAAGGVMRWLEEQGMGLPVHSACCPSCRPPCCLICWWVMPGHPPRRRGRIPGLRGGQHAPAQGNVGAGAGALVGKLFGIDRAMKGGIGTASVTVAGVTVGALMACNALGDVVDPATGQVLAGARTTDGNTLLDTRRAILAGEAPQPLLAGTNTTLAVVATDAVLTKAQAHRLAQVAHDGLARAINPVHTMSDGDTVFALGTGHQANPRP